MKDVKKILKETIENVDNFAILLSSGVDSRALFFESIEQKKKFQCYTFRLDNVISTDFIEAKKLCKMYSIKFNEILLSSNIDNLIKDLYILYDLGARKKTEYECFWPMLYVYKEVKEDIIISGLGADGHFCLSKKAMIHYKERPDEYRNLLFSSSDYCQVNLHSKFKDKLHLMPYLSQAMQDEFRGTTWTEVNKPRQKQPIVDAYKSYFDKIRLFKHINYQIGDSMIQVHFQKLLDTHLNTGNFKSVVSIYNRLKHTRICNQQSII